MGPFSRDTPQLPFTNFMMNFLRIDLEVVSLNAFPLENDSPRLQQPKLLQALSPSLPGNNNAF